MDKYEILNRYFGHSSFRNGQEQIIDNITQGKDVLAVMPTGAGKSMCYQVPALMGEGLTVVISPLISLMKDQVYALEQAGVEAAFINSSLTGDEYNAVLSLARRGAYRILYAAPERLLAPSFVSLCRSVSIPMIAIDEAHCVSQWGHDFRPSYLKISEFINSLPFRPVVGAFTATATDKVREDIINILGLHSPYLYKGGFDRPNLFFGVIKPGDKKSELLNQLKKYKDKSGIVYCSTRKNVEEVCDMLRENGWNATRYHAGLTEVERKNNQEEFVYDKKTVMVATNAFGMGIDKSNVSFVIHYNMPKNIESYYQEAGRAGRDGSAAECTILYSKRDVRTNRFLIENSESSGELSDEEYENIKASELERLKLMTYYCSTSDCLRGYILHYFGEHGLKKDCGNCSSCLSEYEVADITVDAQKIMSCIGRTKQRFTAKVIAEVLHGSNTEKIRQLGLDTQSTYGIMSEYTLKYIRDLIEELISKGYLAIDEDDYYSLKLLNQSADILRNGKTVAMKVKRSVKTEESKKNTDIQADGELFARLKRLRSILASNQGVPAYVVFSDASLRDMCVQLPQSDDEFLAVSGVGEKKLLQYGKRFMKVINDYIASAPQK